VKLTLIENFRALFYAPFYAAFELGAWKAEGLDVSMITGGAAGQTIGMLAAGAAEVSWGGPLRVILAHEKDPASDTVAFCEVVGRDPFFLIGREPNAGFRMADLVGKRVAITSEVPTPGICLTRDLQLAGIDPEAIARTPPRTMGENAAALRAGEVDVIQVFQPYAQTLIDEGVGHLWYAAATRGLCCYTTLNTTRRFIQENPQALLAMTRGMFRAQKWIFSHSGTDLVEVVGSYLPDVPRDVLAACFEKYKALGTWSRDPVVKRAGIEWKRDALLACGMIRNGLDYEAYVDPHFGEAAVRDDPPSM
jgi:NitT/TauT family transport system substrate-binding protein